MSATRVLIVDDNKGYREAFRRNLILHGYEVQEAEDSIEALEAVQSAPPDVIVTDLAMRHPTEGLDLIRQVRSIRPHLPVIMISAVGTFDEGAEATRLGACHVISKSRIDEELGDLLRTIDEASEEYAATRRLLDEIASLAAESSKDRSKVTDSLNAILERDDVHQAAKGTAFDLLLELSRTSSDEAHAQPAAREDLLATATQEVLSDVERTLTDEVPSLAKVEPATRESLVTAEYLYQQSESSRAGVDFSRSMGFAYCFAVENEVKARLRKKLQKFFGDPGTRKIVEGLFEKNRRSISIFFQQYLLRSKVNAQNEATIDNYFHTFLRLIEHGARYRPDGLKALGIILIAFGRTYSFKKFGQEITIDNPFELKGIGDGDNVIEFANLLINLQHYRNPYIHPELSEMTKLSKIRETAFACLNTIAEIR